MKIPIKASGEWRVASDAVKNTEHSHHPSPVTRHPSHVSGFTMVEIAICLAIIGFALIAIIGVLPIGMNTQRDNREETLVNQDATMFIEAIRNGARGLDDLTNYVYAITNYWTYYANGHTNAGVNGYTYFNSSAPPSTPYNPSSPINSGTNIIGLLSTPEYTDNNGLPIPSLIFGGYSNHIVAYVRSISGPAVEKPPQDNPIIRGDANNPGDSFGYRLLCVNGPVAVDTNLFYLYPVWQPKNYSLGDEVFYNWSYWAAGPNTTSLDTPGLSIEWTRSRIYGLELMPNLHELRLTFLWPQLPNGNLGPGRQTWRTMVAGQLVLSPAYTNLYFYQSQTFNKAL